MTNKFLYLINMSSCKKYVQEGNRRNRIFSCTDWTPTHPTGWLFSLNQERASSIGSTHRKLTYGPSCWLTTLRKRKYGSSCWLTTLRIRKYGPSCHLTTPWKRQIHQKTPQKNEPPKRPLAQTQLQMITTSESSAHENSAHHNTSRANQPSNPSN